jgi:hypothetical protein
VDRHARRATLRVYRQNDPEMPGVLGSAVTLALAVGVAFEAPASASVRPRIPEGQAAIRGPGLDRPLELSGQPFFDLIYMAGLIPDWSPPPPGQHVPSSPAGPLGPPYDVFYSFPVAGQGPVPLVQTFYFEAANRGVVWVHTLRGQGIPLTGGGRLDVPEGWWRSPVLSDFLRAVALAEGITEFPPDEAQAPASPSDQTAIAAPGQPEESEEAPGAGTRVLLGLGALGLLLLLGAFGGRPAGERT